MPNSVVKTKSSPSDSIFCSIRSLSDVEEDTSDSEIAIEATNLNEVQHLSFLSAAIAPVSICVTPPRLSKGGNPPSLLSWTSPRTAPFATVISSSPSTSLTLPFARPVRSPPRVQLPRRFSADMESRWIGDVPKSVPQVNNGNPQERSVVGESLPVACVRTALESKANPLQLQPWCQLLLTLDGRDKVTKLLQYWSRLLAWWLVSGSSGQKRADALKVSLTTSRKAFRLGRSLLEVQKLSDLGFWEWLVGFKSCDSNGDPAWKILGNSFKTLGLLGFWAFDNASFLTGSGVLDDFSIQEPKLRVHKRQQLATSCSILANRSYFAGSVAGLVTSWISYRKHREKLRELMIRQDPENRDEKVIKGAKQEQFVLFLALVKSCCDVLVFSNNPGIDFWTKARGKKLPEGLHCVAGLLSASTVLYNKYPDA